MRPYEVDRLRDNNARWFIIGIGVGIVFSMLLHWSLS